MRDRLLDYHHQDTEEFQAALTYTGTQTGFTPELIEKDYFCSLVLQYLYAEMDLHELIFKGGTCLNKVYLGFFRLSEDLDFSISTPLNSTQTERSQMIKPIKKLIQDLGIHIPGCRVTKSLVGANQSTQYFGEINYTSVFSEDSGKIKIDIGLGETLQESSFTTHAKTLVMNPFSGKPLLPSVPVKCLSWNETLAEKVRAIFTRKEIAVRDFFDLWHAKRNLKFTFDESTILSMAVKKISVSNYPFAALSKERLDQLEKQMITDLKPVLTDKSFRQFHLSEAMTEAKSFEAYLKNAF